MSVTEEGQVLIMILEYFSSLNPLTLVNALPGNVAQGLIWGIMALGVFLTFRLLDFADLTVDGSLATGGAVAVMLIRGGMHPALALVFAFISGMLAGLVTGLLHTALGIPGILASILTQISLYSINLTIMGKANQGISVDNYPLVASISYVTGDMSKRIVFFVGLIVGILVIIGIMYWFFGTELGAAIRTTGCNQNMARAQGISTKFMTVFALMLSNGLVALCGGVLAQYQGFSDVNMGRGAIVIGLAAVIIGEVLFAKLCAGKGISFAYTMMSVVFGAILYYVVISVVLWFKMPQNLMKMFSAVVVACFLAVPYLKAKYGHKKRKVAKAA